MSIEYNDLMREFGNDRVARARAFLSRSKLRRDKREADYARSTAEFEKKMAAAEKKKTAKLQCYTLTAKDGHKYVTCDDKNKKKKKKLPVGYVRGKDGKLKKKRLVIIPDKPVNKSVPFQPDFEGGLQDLNQLLFRQGEYELLNINRRGHTFL